MESGPSKRLFYFWDCFVDWCVFPAHNFCFSFNLFVNHSLVFNFVLFIGWSADLFLSRVPFFVGIEAEIKKSKTMSKPSYEMKGFPCEGIAKLSYICIAAKPFAIIKQRLSSHREFGQNKHMYNVLFTCVQSCLFLAPNVVVKINELTLSWSSYKSNTT